MQLVSKISNLCDHKSPTLQTDGRTDGRTDRRHAIARPRKCTKVHCAVKTNEATNQPTSEQTLVTIPAAVYVLILISVISRLYSTVYIHVGIG